RGDAPFPLSANCSPTGIDSVLDGHAAIDVDCLAGDPRTLIGAEVERHPGDLIPAARTLQWHSSVDDGFQCVVRPHVVQPVGIHEAGADRVHANPVLADLLGHGGGYRVHAGLRRCVG